MRVSPSGLALVAATLFRVAAADAVVTGTIFGPGSQSFPIAVAPLKQAAGDDGGLGARFVAVLSRDLDLSGYFRVLDPRTFVEDPQAAGITAAETDFVGWAAIGAQMVVKGWIEVKGDLVTVEVRLLDVPGRAEVPQVGRRFRGTRADLPRMAHKTADSILEFLTGERGPFDSAIALVAQRGRELKEVYWWTFDQDQPTRVTNERSLVVNPRWRPDARAILFTSYREHLPHLFQVDVATRQVRRLVPGKEVTLDGAWSPDGSKLLVTRETDGNTDIYLLDRQGRTLRRLTDHWAIDVAPAWAPDGRRFAFCSSRAGSPQVYTMGIDGSELRRVSRSGSYNTSPAWSPEGDRLAYTTRGAGGAFQVVVSSLDGLDARPITAVGSNENPSWAPDGRYLVFSSRQAGRSHLVMADRDGRTRKQLTRGAWNATSPAWSPRRD
jgi:TolB protein